MNQWEARKRIELEAKLSSLQADLHSWSARSKAGEQLEKHHSQLLRLEADFLPVTTLLIEDAADQTFTERWRAIERTAQDLLTVWGFFRDKLAVRMVDDYERYLSVADDFAWACYERAQRAAIAAGSVSATAVREPPLTCLNDVDSPYSLARGSAFDRELTSARHLVGSAQTLLTQLPIPVIGLPWFQLQHLPDALVIAHEIGHLVMQDVSLEEPVTALLTDAAPGVPATWSGELFADVFGVLSVGGSFASALADFLRVAGASDEPTDRYPPTKLRLALCLAVLELDRIGSTEASASLRAQWAAEGLEIPRSTAETGGRIATALATSRLERFGSALVEVLAFDVAAERRKDEEATELLARRPSATKDVRELLAAAAAAFARDPGRYSAYGLGDAVLHAARCIREPGVRWRVAGPPEIRSLGETEGRALYDTLMRENA